MKKGKTEVDTLRINGWGVGDILEGDEGYGPVKIRITAIGEEKFLCKWLYTTGWGDESGNTTLLHRDWKKVDSVQEIVSKGI
jgi:hypothetical protein